MRSSDVAPRSGPSPVARRLLPVLLLLDIGFIALHLDARNAGAAAQMHRLDFQGSYAGMFFHAKELGAALALVVLAWRSRAAVHAAWALLFVHLLLDASLALHERGGTYLAERLMLPGAFGLGPEKLCALAVSLAAGTVLVGLVGLTHVLAERTDRHGSARLLSLLLVMLSFGICVDLLTIVWRHPPAESLTVIEDGGETIAMTLILAHATSLATKRT